MSLPRPDAHMANKDLGCKMQSDVRMGTYEIRKDLCEEIRREHESYDKVTTSCQFLVAVLGIVPSWSKQLITKC